MYMKGHVALSKELLSEHDPTNAFLELLGAFFIWPKQITEEHLGAFTKIPLNQMPLYMIEPDPIPPYTFCPLPIPGKGPLVWQVILSRWRLLVSL
jgi:hypothetical protein